MKEGSYLLGEMDRSVSQLRYAAFQLLPYFPRTQITIPVTDLTGLADDELDEYDADKDMEIEEDEEEEMSTNN